MGLHGQLQFQNFAPGVVLILKAQCLNYDRP